MLLEPSSSSARSCRPRRRPPSPCRRSRCGSAPSRRASIPRARSPSRARAGRSSKAPGRCRAPRSSCGRRRRRRNAPSRRATASTPLDGHPTFALIADPCQTRRMILDRSSWRLASETVAVRAAADRGHAAGPAAGEAVRARHGQLAVVPRRPGGRRGGRPAAAGHLEPEDGRAHALADADPRPRALEPDRVGRSRVRDQRRQQRSEGDVQARTLRRRRCVGRSLARSGGCSTRSTSATGKIAVGARRLRGRAARACATSSRPTPAPRRRPTAGSSSRRSARRASTPTTSTARCCGRSISAASTWAPTTSRPSSGAPASSPIIWNGLVILQCDTQADSFLRGARRRRPARRCGRPSATSCRRGARRRWRRRRRAPELVTNASNFVRGYDPRTGKELWRLGRQLEDHRADADLRRRPARRRQRPRARAADLRRQGRRARRPDAERRPDQQPGGRLEHGPAAAPTCRRRSPTRASSTCSRNNGLFDAYDLQTGEEIYRQRLPVGRQRLQRVAGRGRRQDLPVERGRRDPGRRRRAATFKHLATNSMGELLMATPALSDGTMFVRSSTSVSAISGK